MIQLQGLIKEEWFNNQPLSEEQRQGLLEKISNYNQYASQVYNESDPVNVAKELMEIVKFAEAHLNETTEAFDKVTMNRNLKEMKSYVTQFSKTATEQKAINQRLTSLYEEVGIILQRYFDIKDLQ